VGGRLAGRVAVITGGAGSIGGAIVQRFCQEGARVVVADLDVSRSEAFVAGLDVPDSMVTFIRPTPATTPRSGG
jgi:NAD(P)-dependent dehydrogenase (short-subunit alcohol dehydrogenase family)